MATYVIGAVVFAAIGYASYRVIKNSVSGKCTCGCGGSCPGCSSVKSDHTK
ncbi:MAG: FeoB-associated Cys-rich membrane protein [Synergistaceae bacterium]|nr:FeoB-associated Cys-rich membrane protein [Synergistaceae bacterium]